MVGVSIYVGCNVDNCEEAGGVFELLGLLRCLAL